MSTVTDERVDSIEHLAHEPTCDRQRRGGPVHGECPPKADYWLKYHECHEMLWCSECVADARRAVRNGARCKLCGERFADFHALFPQVVPL